MEKNVARPEFVGRFYKLDNFRHVYQVIVDHQLYFSSISYFNDPFDMRPAPFNFKRFKAISSKLEIESRLKEFEQIWNEKHSDLSGIGVCCFTDKCDNIKMWSHYGDKHRGICLIFDTKYKFFDGLSQVRYVRTRPKLPPTRKNSLERKDRVLEVLTSKHQSWVEESEWRLFRRDGNKNYEYPKSALKGIIFGLACTAEDKSLILRLFPDRTKIKCFEIKPSEHEYKLEINKLECK